MEPSEGRTNRVLVTGASGFIGASLCRSLTTAGWEVVGLVRRLPSEQDAIERVEYRQGDIRDPATLTHDLLQDCRAVVHTVGIITEIHGQGQIYEAIHINGTQNLLRATRRVAVGDGEELPRFLYLSALGAAPDAPSAYARSKAVAETLVRESDLPYTILRPSIVLGPGAEFLERIARLIRRPPLTPFPLPFVPVPGKGKNRFQPVYIGDLCACVVGSLKKENRAVRNATVEVGGADAVTFDELIRGVQERIGAHKPLLHIPMPLLFAGAAVLEALLPVPPVTTDQLLNLKRDNVCDIAPLRDAFALEPLTFTEAMDRIYRSESGD